MKRLLALLLFCAPALSAQVPVALSPTPRMQFFSEVTPSVPLAGGKVCTFNAGTTMPAATYSDISGTFQNTNPIVLDGSGFATIYLANQEYKFIVYDSSGNGACPNTGVQQWSQDNISAFQPVVGTQTIVFAGVTSDPVGQAGMVDYRTDLGRLRFFNSAWDSIPGLATVDTLSNKTMDLATNTVTGGGNIAGHYPRNNGVKYVDSAIQAADVPQLGAGIGNGLLITAKAYFAAAGCNNTSASSFWDLPTATPAVAACSTGTNTQKGILNYAQAAGGFSAQTSLLLPSDFTSTADFRLIWLTTATSGTAQWKIFWACTPVTASATDDPAFANSVTISSAVPGVANQLQTASSTGNTLTGCAAGNMLHLKVFRDGNVDGVAATLSFDGLELTFRRAM